jgi:hypothetical protein
MKNLSRKIHSSQFVKIHRELNGELDWEFSLKMQNYITNDEKPKQGEYSVNQNSYISDYVNEWFEQFKKDNL